MPDAPPPLSLRLTLDDGTPVTVRPVAPSDRNRLVTGFDGLSAASRRSRFLRSVSGLSAEEVHYFTDVDQTGHVAWGVLYASRPDAPGLGRFIQLPRAPGVAEFSLTVPDAAQNRGVGRLLLAVLAARAPSVGVRVLRGVVAPQNVRMAAWLRRLGARTVLSGDDLTLDLPVPVDPAASPSARAFDLLVGRIHEGWTGAEPV